MTMEQGSEPKAILVVEDDEIYRERLMRAFRERGMEVFGAEDGERALGVAAEESPDMVVVDLKMPKKSGLDVLKELRKLDEDVRVVVLTGYGSIATAMEAVRLGAVHYLTKPADADEILAAFDREATEPYSGTDSPKQAPSLARAEWEHINRVLSDCGGNISQAARVLGLHRRSLQRKLAKYPPRR
ncbi:MAG: response regulator [Myxococcota bacterium]